MASITEYEPVASVVWHLADSLGYLDRAGGEHFEFYGPGWTVGCYSASQCPESAVTIVDGVPFVLDDGRQSSRLVRAVLDYTDGAFFIHEAAA